MAQGKRLKVQLPSEGDWLVWSGDSVTKGPDDSATAATELDSSSFTPQTYLLALNQNVNSVVSVQYSAVSATGVWVVNPKYTHAGWLTVRVEHKGEAVAGASIVAAVGKVTREKILTPESKGEVKFFGLPLGEARVSAKYSADGETKTSNAQVVTLMSDGRDPPRMIVSIADEVETIAAGTAKPAADKGSPRAKEVPEASVFGKILGYLLGLLAAVGIGYGLLKLVQKNENQIKGHLGKLGVHVPTDEELNPDQGNNPVIPIKPQPVQPIVLDPVAPIDQGVAPISMIANPRLVAADGSVLMIGEGSGVVGREGTAEFPVPQDSVSRQHARIARQGDSVVVSDLGSTNKTYVNGSPISSDTVLHPGDSVQFGTAQFRYEV